MILITKIIKHLEIHPVFLRLTIYSHYLNEIIKVLINAIVSWRTKWDMFKQIVMDSFAFTELQNWKE